MGSEMCIRDSLHKFTNPKIKDGVKFSKAIVKRLEDEEVAYDIASYRDARPVLRDSKK